MGKFGWNLPPGVSVRDIPGNRPEEEAAEAAYQSMCEHLELEGLVNPLTVDEEWYDKLVQFIQKKMGEAHSTGYQAAMADQREANEIKETEELAKQWKESQ